MLWHKQLGSSGLVGAAGGSLAWAGSRGIFAGAFVTLKDISSDIDYISIATPGNASDFGNMSVASYGGAAVSNSTRGVICTGVANEYITIATTGNSVAFGTLTYGGYYRVDASDGTRGVIGGGDNFTYTVPQLEYITIATTGNGSDFGNLVYQQTKRKGSANDATRAVFASGSGGPSPTYATSIETLVIQTTGSSAGWGSLSYGRIGVTGVSDGTRAVYCGGLNGSAPSYNYNAGMDYSTIATASTAVTFGNLARGRDDGGGTSDGTIGIVAGGKSPTAISNIDHFVIATTGNASSFGSLSFGGDGIAACSGA